MPVFTWISEKNKNKKQINKKMGLAGLLRSASNATTGSSCVFLRNVSAWTRRLVQLVFQDYVFILHSSSANSKTRQNNPDAAKEKKKNKMNVF